jgi:hypothetical protein
MIDDMMRAERLYEVPGLRTRSRRDDRQIGELTGDLDGNGTDTTSTANDQNGRSGTGYGLL